MNDHDTEKSPLNGQSSSNAGLERLRRKENNMAWKSSAGIAIAMFIGGAIQGVAGNTPAMVAAFCATGGWAVAAIEEWKNMRSNAKFTGG